MAKFEEKAFESYFNIELNRRASIYFPFGQVQEGGIGADAAAMSGSRRIWRLLGYPYFFSMPFDGIFLREVADDIERSLDMHVIELHKFGGLGFALALALGLLAGNDGQTSLSPGGHAALESVDGLESGLA